MPKLVITLKPNQRLGLFFILMYGSAMLLLLLGTIQGWLYGFCALGLIVLCAWDAYETWRRYVTLVSPSSVVAIEWDRLTFRWWIKTAAQEYHEVTLSPHGVLTTALILLNFKTRQGKKRFVVILTPDAIEGDDFRRLQVGLRLIPTVWWRKTEWSLKNLIKRS